MTIAWMSWKEEISQRHENLMLHGFQGMAVSYIAVNNGMSPLVAVASATAWGFLWELGGNLLTKKARKPWKASLLGALTYPAGALAAGAVRSMGG